MKQKILTFLEEHANIGYSYNRIWEIIQDDIITSGMTPNLSCSADLYFLYKEGKLKRCKVNNLFHYYFEKI